MVGGELSRGIRDDGACGEQKAFVSMDALLLLSLVHGERNFLNPKLRHQFSQPTWIALRKSIAKLKVTPLHVSFQEMQKGFSRKTAYRIQRSQVPDPCWTWDHRTDRCSSSSCNAMPLHERS